MCAPLLVTFVNKNDFLCKFLPPSPPAPFLSANGMFGDVQSAVTWLCFSPNSEQIITASKDGTIRIWNINGIYQLHDFLQLLLPMFVVSSDCYINAMHNAMTFFAVAYC